MNSLNFSQNIKRKLVKIALIIFLGSSLSVNSFSNPIIPPPMILEVYFGPEGWQIELLNNGYESEYNLDYIWLWGQYDVAHFKPGIDFNPGEVVVVTQDDLLTPMVIEQAGDYLTLFYINGADTNELDYLGLSWGTFCPYPGWGVTAPVGEQSIAYQRFDYYDDWDYWLVKEQPNSIGLNPGQVSKRANFQGYVKDKNNEPLEDIFIDFCSYYYGSSDPDVPMIWTGPDGQFSTDDMFCKKYYISFKIDDFYGPEIGDTTVIIEPDSANYFEFKLDTLLTGIKENEPAIPCYSIYNIPNPSSSQTKFIIDISNPKPGQKGLVKIYNEAGFIVDIVPVEISGNKQEISYNFNDKSLAQGVYFYNLETGHQKVASGKMIVTQ